MELTINPIMKNIEQIKVYTETLPEKSPFRQLSKYEERLKAGSLQRALMYVCDTDQSRVINDLEGLVDVNWFKVSNLTDTKDIPSNYFDIIFWSGCDLETELRNVIKVYPKLKESGRIYFNTTLTDLNNIFAQTTTDLQQEDLTTLIQRALEKILMNIYSVKL